MEKSRAKWRLCAIVSECFSVQRSLILWVFSAFAVTHPLLRLACRCHTCLCSTTAEAKLKLSKKSPLSRAPENQAYSFTTQTGLWVWNGTRSLGLLLFWSQKFATATQTLVKKTEKATLAPYQADRFDSLQMSAIVTARIRVDIYQHPSASASVTLKI